MAQLGYLLCQARSIREGDESVGSHLCLETLFPPNLSGDCPP